MAGPEIPTSFWREHLRHKVSAVVLLAVIAGVFAITVLMYEQAFTPRAEVTLKTPRAGLQMRSGTVVKLRGVDVGRIGSVTASPAGADIALEIRPEMLAAIPANVGVSLEQLTAFGNKHVALTLPPTPSAARLHAGSVVDTRHVSVEVNTVFDKLDGVLQTLRPQQVNAMLGAIAGTVQGRGDQLGHTIDRADGYLGKLEHDLPQLQRDLGLGAQVANTYAAATPPLMAVLRNGSTTARSVTTEAGNLDATLDAFTALSRSGGQLLAANSDKLVAALRAAVPTTKLLEKYSPEFECLFKGEDRAFRRELPNWGTKAPGLTADIKLLPGNAPYSNPENLPNQTATNGPACHGMPDFDPRRFPPSLLRPFDNGGTTDGGRAGADRDSLARQPAVVQLFGPLANLGGTPIQLAPPPRGRGQR